MRESVKRTHEVFGISNTILKDSYVDRGELDERLQIFLERSSHIALRGESKCGKSWTRQNNIPDAIVVQCRFGKSIIDIYTDALSQIEIQLITEETTSNTLKGSIVAKGTIGSKLLSAIGLETEVVGEKETQKVKVKVGHDISDLRYVADLIKASGRRLVVEDFHYLSVEQRKYFSSDLKALWDYGCFVIIIGVWSQNNMLTSLNPDLTGRIQEVSIYWELDDLRRVVEKGSEALGIRFDEELMEELTANCYGNVGILQSLALKILDAAEIYVEQRPMIMVSDLSLFKTAANSYASDLNARYLSFAEILSSGMRTRNNNTGIYAHAMAVIVEAEDNKLINGLSLDEIYQKSNSRQPRIQKGNMRTVLKKLEELQVDNEGRGLVLDYDEAEEKIIAVDRQLLFYRKFLSARWPWEDMIRELEGDLEEGET